MKESQPNSFFNIEKLKANTALGEIAELYAEVFATPPWNEYTRCENCLEFFGQETRAGEVCPKCGGELTLAYPKEETIVQIREELSKPDSLCLVIKKSPLIAFAWGFSYDSPSKFAQEKYRTEEMQRRIKGILEKSGISGKFFYLSECGVEEKERGRGLSNILVETLLQEAKKKNLPVVMRTNWQSPIMAVAEKFKMTQIMGPKVEIDRKNKLIKKAGRVTNFADTEIEERALLIKF